jgi:catechol 2,3-dioxygenase-like lactoylglutathione lyase family enzyme
MRLHHLIIGVKDLAQTEVFYRELLGFKLIDAFLDSGTNREGLVMVHTDESGLETLELLFVPFAAARLPSPQHIALEVGSTHFNQILAAAKKFAIPIRAHPELESRDTGTSRIQSRGREYETFYVLDPNGLNLEISRRLGEN